MLKLPLSRGKNRATRCPERGRKTGGQQRGQEEKRTRENGSVDLLLSAGLAHKCRLSSFVFLFKYRFGCLSKEEERKLPFVLTGSLPFWMNLL